MTKRSHQNTPRNIVFAPFAGCYNKGSEAIIRCLHKYLRDELGEYNLTILSANPSTDTEELSDLSQTRVLPILPERKGMRFAAKVLFRAGAMRSGARFRSSHLSSVFDWADAMFEIGGDTVGLHYGGPWVSLELLGRMKRLGKTAAIEAASVGPFKAGVMERHAKRVLASLDAVCAREQITYEALREMGLTNVYRVADPAFLLEPIPVELPGWPDDRVLGVGISASFARYLGRSTERYIKDSVSLISTFLETSRGCVAFIPHVFFRQEKTDDFSISEEIAQQCKLQERIWMLPHRRFGPGQLKYVIGRCDAFIGARTHATIAALSQRIPTATLTYSHKSRGIFKDAYGSERYVVSPAAWGKPETMDLVRRLFEKGEAVRSELEEGVDRLIELAHENGRICVKVARGEDM